MAFWQVFFCVIWRLPKVLSVNPPTTHIDLLTINFPIARTSVTQKNCFRIICVIIPGLIVVIAEALARVIAAIRVTSTRWRSYLPLIEKLVLVDPAFLALRFESRD